MVKEWRTEREVTDGSLTAAGIQAINEAEGTVPSGWDDIPFKELVKQPAEKFVQTMQRWCNKGNAESYGKNKKIDATETKEAFKIVQEAIKKIDKSYFDVKDIIYTTDAVNKTDGSLQRKILAAMVCLGELEVRHVKFKDDKGKEKVKYVFIKSKIRTKCPYLLSGKCNFEWKTGALTDYFPAEFNQEEELV